jgi:predicted DNA-binding protein YlxM (UPF0122 family)
VANEWRPCVVLSAPDRNGLDVYIVRLEPRNPCEMEQSCILEYDIYPASENGVTSSVVHSSIQRVKCKDLYEYSRQSKLKRLKAVSNDVMDQIYWCIKKSDDVSKKVLDTLIRQGKIEANRPLPETASVPLPAYASDR